MPDNITSTVRLFADDTITYLTVSSDSNTLQEYLNKLVKWEERWMMQFHPDKCVVLPITKKKDPLELNYNLHGHNLEHVSSAKYLGVTITSDLMWSAHIQKHLSKGKQAHRLP